MVHSAMDWTYEFAWIKCANIDDSLTNTNGTMAPVCNKYMESFVSSNNTHGIGF